MELHLELDVPARVLPSAVDAFVIGTVPGWLAQLEPVALGSEFPFRCADTIDVIRQLKYKCVPDGVVD